MGSPSQSAPKKARFQGFPALEDGDEIMSAEDIPSASGAARAVGEINVEALAERMEELGFVKSRKRDLDEEKLRILSLVVPESVATMDTLDQRQRRLLFKNVGFFDNILPSALAKDWTSLSERLPV